MINWVVIEDRSTRNQKLGAEKLAHQAVRGTGRPNRDLTGEERKYCEQVGSLGD